jgi:hypothetical protein
MTVVGSVPCLLFLLSDLLGRSAADSVRVRVVGLALCSEILEQQVFGRVDWIGFTQCWTAWVWIF